MDSTKTLDRMTLGERLRYIRMLRNLTQSELAAMANTRQQQITAIENGEVSNPRNLDKLAESLNVPASLLKYGVIAADDVQERSMRIVGKPDHLTEDDQKLIETMIDKLLARSENT